LPFNILAAIPFGLKTLLVPFRYYFYLIAFFGPVLSFSQIGGNNTFEFVNLPFSARAAALGGNTLPTRDDDINLVYQNPSVLSEGMHNQLALTYVNYLSDINYGYAAYARKFPKLGMVGAGLQFVDYGKFLEADQTGQITGQFFAAEYNLALSYAREIDSNFSMGASLKTIYSVLESYWSWGSALDMAITYQKKAKNFTAALLVRNLGYQWRPYREGNREPLPFEIQIGLTKKPEHVPFRFGLILTNLQQWDLTYLDPTNPKPTVDPLTNEPLKEKKVGPFLDKAMRHVLMNGEFMLTKNFNIRLGFNYQRMKELRVQTKPGLIGFSFGFGFKISKFHFSYGHGNYHLAGGTNNFTITTNLSDFYRKDTSAR
jgi:hypothetical protein